MGHVPVFFAGFLRLVCVLLSQAVLAAPIPGSPPQDLGSALIAFSKQAGIDLLYDERLVSGKRTSAVKPAESVEESLAQLLRGSGLTFHRFSTGYVIVKAKPDGPMQTPPGVPNGPEEVTEVVVTGFRNTMARARELEAQATNSISIILAEDIASFPDLNLAESLQRIPGVTISRDSGEGRQITLRALDPSLSLTQLNGMEVLGNTASGMDNRDGISRTRSFDYSIFDAELFNKVTVQKSYAADQDEGGIAGTVQLETAKPFDYSGFKAVLSAKVESNSNADTPTPRLVGLISDRWGDFGALVSVAYDTANSNEFGYRNYNWGQIHIDPANIGPAVSVLDAERLSATGSAEVFAPQAETYSTWFDHRTRLGVTTALQYEPNDRLKLDLDAVYSELRNNRRDYVIGAAGTNGLTGNVTGTQVLQSAVIQGNELVQASFTGVDLRSEANIENDSTQFQQEGLRGFYQANDRLLFSGLLGYSQSVYALPLFDKVFLESQNQAFSFDDRPAMPVNGYRFDTANPALWNLMRTDAQEDFITSRYANAKFDGDFRVDSASSLEAGVGYKTFINSGSQYIDKVFRNTPTDTPLPAYLKLLVPYDTLDEYVVGDVLGTYRYVGQSTNVRSPAFAEPGFNFTIDERTVDAYLQYDFDGELLGMRTKGNFGVRYYSTDLTSSGLLDAGASAELVAKHSNSAGWLPAANLAVNLTENIVFRLSASRDVSRPALTDLAVAGELTTAPFGGTVSSGNPNLKPFTSDAAETSIEYINGRTIASVSIFYKKLDSYITTQVNVEPYAVTGYPLSFLVPGENGSTLFTVTRPVNGPGGSFGGAELNYQRALDFLPAPLDHFGIIANMTYAAGSSPVFFNGVSVNLSLPNLSKYSGNITLYYETELWDARLSSAYRSQYLTGEGGDGNIGAGVKDTLNVDFISHYRVSPHLTFSFEGINLTNQHIIQFVDVHAVRTLVNTGSGSTFIIGANYEF